MLVDLVPVTTRDGLRLDGMFQAAPDASTLPVDALCFLHGTGGNFYSSTLFEALAERLLALGCGVLRVNTRGHDLMSTAATARGGKRQGAAYEVGDECRHDVAAWLDWLRQRVGPRVGLLGHSFGAVKALYALAYEPELPCACAAALSPPRLSYAAFCDGPQGPEFLQTYGLAEQHVQNGQPGALLDVKIPLPFVITAAGYAEKYGPDERYNFLRFVGRVPCPTLVTFGGLEVENNVAFQGVPDALAGTAARHGRMRVDTVPGADHFYSATRGEIVERVAGWLKTL